MHRGLLGQSIGAAALHVFLPKPVSREIAPGSQRTDTLIPSEKSQPGTSGEKVIKDLLSSHSPYTHPQCPSLPAASWLASDFCRVVLALPTSLLSSQVTSLRSKSLALERGLSRELTPTTGVRSGARASQGFSLRAFRSRQPGEEQTPMARSHFSYSLAAMGVGASRDMGVLAKAHAYLRITLTCAVAEL